VEQLGFLSLYFDVTLIDWFNICTPLGMTPIRIYLFIEVECSRLIMAWMTVSRWRSGGSGRLGSACYQGVSTQEADE